MSLRTSTSELKQIIYDSEDFLLVDTRPFSEYSVGHIPGAVNIDLFQYLWLDTSKIGISQFLRHARILLSNIGIKNEKSIIFYDNTSCMAAARGVLLLLFFSHNKVNVLDGGFDKWKREISMNMKLGSPIISTYVKKPLIMPKVSYIYN